MKRFPFLFLFIVLPVLWYFPFHMKRNIFIEYNGTKFLKLYKHNDKRKPGKIPDFCHVSATTLSLEVKVHLCLHINLCKVLFHFTLHDHIKNASFVFSVRKMLTTIMLERKLKEELTHSTRC